MGRPRKYASDQARSAAYNQTHRSMGAEPMKQNDQSLAIALNTQRQARKKMAKGGMMKGTPGDMAHEIVHDCLACGGTGKYAEGGEVMDDDDMDGAPGFSPLKESYRSPEDGFMGEDWTGGGDSLASKLRKKYADGGDVDLQENENEDLNDEDKQSYKAAREDYYDLDQLDDQPEDSNETGDDLDERDQGDKEDKLAKYRKKK